MATGESKGKRVGAAASARLLLSEDRVRLVLREDDALVDHLHRVVLLGHAVLREEHHPEAAGAEEAEELEVVDRRLRRRLELPRDERRVRARAQEARVDVVPQREDDVVEHRVEEVRVHRAAPRRRERRLDPRALEARDADAHRRGRCGVLAVDLARAEAPKIGRCDLLELHRLEAEEQVLDARVVGAEPLEALEQRAVRQNFLERERPLALERHPSDGAAELGDATGRHGAERTAILQFRALRRAAGE